MMHRKIGVPHLLCLLLQFPVFQLVELCVTPTVTRKLKSRIYPATGYDELILFIRKMFGIILYGKEEEYIKYQTRVNDFC
jgi:hypothetical protein